MLNLPNSLQQLIDGLKSLPWIWEKSAQRYAFFLLKKDKAFLQELWWSISQSKDKLKECDICCSYTEQAVCEICETTSRKRSNGNIAQSIKGKPRLSSRLFLCAIRRILEDNRLSCRV